MTAREEKPERETSEFDQNVGIVVKSQEQRNKGVEEVLGAVKISEEIRPDPKLTVLQSKPDGNGETFKIQVWDNAFNPEVINGLLEKDGTEWSKSPNGSYMKRVELDEAVNKEMKQVLQKFIWNENVEQPMPDAVEFRRWTGGQGKPHVDLTHAKDGRNTVCFYLSDDPNGGTFFPRAKQHVAAIAGRVATWRSLKQDGKIEERSEHYAKATSTRYSCALLVDPKGEECIYRAGRISMIAFIGTLARIIFGGRIPIDAE